MARKQPLRVAQPDERAPAKPLRVVEALDSDERTFLVALRARLARELDSAPSHAVASLVAKLRDVDKTIRTIDAMADREDAPGTSGRRGVVASTDDEAWDGSTS